MSLGDEAVVAGAKAIAESVNKQLHELTDVMTKMVDAMTGMDERLARIERKLER